MSREAEYKQEAATLRRIELTLDEYVQVLRKEQQKIQSMMIEVLSQSWQSGASQSSFLSYMEVYYKEFGLKIQKIEEALADVTRGIRDAEDKAQAEAMRAAINLRH